MEKNVRNAADAYARLIETIHILRAPGGCPWDREQTPLSMRRDLVEEVFEAVEAVTSDEPLHAREELGDVMLNASLMMYMYEQAGDFTVADALNELTDKLIRRHPHVFAQSEGAAVADGKAETSEEVLSQWDKIKQKVEHRETDSILDEVPKGFPPLLRAYKMQKKASKKGFDWKNLEPVEAKIREELAEVNEAVAKVRDASAGASASAGESASAGGGAVADASANTATETAASEKIKPLSVHSHAALDDAHLHMEEEFGDLFFAVVNYARHNGVDPEIAMCRANEKFYRRFCYVEKKMKERGVPMDAEHLAQADAFWDEAKSLGK